VTRGRRYLRGGGALEGGRPPPPPLPPGPREPPPAAPLPIDPLEPPDQPPELEDDPPPLLAPMLDPAPRGPPTEVPELGVVVVREAAPDVEGLDEPELFVPVSRVPITTPTPRAPTPLSLERPPGETLMEFLAPGAPSTGGPLIRDG